MTQARLNELGDILLAKLGSVAVSKNALASVNPTVQEVLATGIEIDS